MLSVLSDAELTLLELDIKYGSAPLVKETMLKAVQELQSLRLQLRDIPQDLTIEELIEGFAELQDAAEATNLVKHQPIPG